MNENYYWTVETEVFFKNYIHKIQNNIKVTKSEEKEIIKNLTNLCRGVFQKFNSKYYMKMPEETYVHDMVSHLFCEVIKKFNLKKNTKVYSYLTYCAKTFLIRTYHKNKIYDSHKNIDDMITQPSSKNKNNIEINPEQFIHDHDLYYVAKYFSQCEDIDDSIKYIKEQTGFSKEKIIDLLKIILADYSYL